MSLGFYSKVIYCLRARGHVNCVGFYTIPYNRARVLGVGLPNVGKNLISYEITSYVRVLDNR